MNEEDVLRDLLHRSTGDLHASRAVTDRVVTRHRRARRRSQALGVAGAAAAVGAAVGVVATANGGARPATAAPRLQLTAAQHALYRLSSIAADAARPTGRYVVLTEVQHYTQGRTDQAIDRTSVIDSVTGDTWTYQRDAGVPASLPVARHGSPTQVEFAAMPTTTAALRSALIGQYDQDQARAAAAVRAQLAKLPARLRRLKTVPKPLPETANDKVFIQATDTLWNPVVGPALRSALFRVLATTPGVRVNEHATDGRGRPAVEISRVDSVSHTVNATFESPSTSAVLETEFITPANPQAHEGTSIGSDVYLSLTRTNAAPSDPYSR